MKKFTGISLSLTYITILCVTAIINKEFPLQVASAVHSFLPVRIDLAEQPFIRYRMILFLVATITLIILAPIVGWVGFRDTNTEKIKRIHWMYFVISIPLMSILWIGYPFLSLCTICWFSNDFVYLFFTVSIFITLQLCLQVIFIKFHIIRGT